jgi:hypothetical protein
MRATTQREIMSHDDECGSMLFVELEEEIHDLFARLAIEVPRRFVGEEHCRLIRKGARDPDTLLFATGKLGWVVISPAPEAYPVEQRAGRFGGFGWTGRPVRGEQFEGHEYILESSERRDEVEALEDESDTLRTHRRTAIFVEGFQFYAREPNTSLARAIQAGQKTEQRRLAAAGWTENDDDLTLSYFEIDTVEYGQHRIGRWAGIRHTGRRTL